MIRVELARSAGFCYGVKRAVELAEKAAEENSPCVMLGHLIHNDHVIQRLEHLGVGCVNRPEDVPEGATVIIRSHGEGRDVYEKLKQRGAVILDATCPNVTQIHTIVSQAEREGRTAVIIGTPDHPEVRAIAGWCNAPVVLADEAAFSAWLEERAERRSLPLTLVSQTTASRASWNSCTEKAKKECTNAKIFDTICGATDQRQKEARLMAQRNDAVVVIGDR